MLPIVWPVEIVLSWTSLLGDWAGCRTWGLVEDACTPMLLIHLLAVTLVLIQKDSSSWVTKPHVVHWLDLVSCCHEACTAAFLGWWDARSWSFAIGATESKQGLSVICRISHGALVSMELWKVCGSSVFRWTHSALDPIRRHLHVSVLERQVDYFLFECLFLFVATFVWCLCYRCFSVVASVLRAHLIPVFFSILVFFLLLTRRSRRPRHHNLLLSWVFRDRIVHFWQFPNHFIHEFGQWLVLLGGLGIWFATAHFFLLKKDSVAEHLRSYVTIKVSVNSFEVLGSTLGRNMRRTVRLREQQLVNVLGLAAAALHSHYIGWRNLVIVRICYLKCLLALLGWGATGWVVGSGTRLIVWVR